MKYNSVEEWKAEATRRFGPDMLKWRFRCPMSVSYTHLTLPTNREV